jgi:hypothetical protein
MGYVHEKTHEHDRQLSPETEEIYMADCSYQVSILGVSITLHNYYQDYSA